ncbi:DUF6489 family protein [Ruegeria sp. 2012CJ41-6]|uniref:DUF6489 family protein n=1 Tax=Ruegeria spongiae TaxID=2942209 RepID=A0ABT0PXW5_9RHOB|nr:DUF6489 family protein [Ruegeria spongiae]MCL6282460.1 DUF6489 family protein [Ruegeria spongiae]
MQVNITVDLTPAEARELLGLPNIQKIQEEWLKKVEARILGDAENFSPENILNSWVAGASGNADLLRGLMSAFTGGSKS